MERTVEDLVQVGWAPSRCPMRREAVQVSDGRAAAEDYLDPGSQAVLTRTLAKVTAGSIVSLHLGHQGTIDALPGILRGLGAKGLTAVRLTELLGQTR